MKILSYLTLIFLVFYSKISLAQAGQVEMADVLRENGKIYVVVAVLSIVFIGIITYLFMIDEKVSKLEKEFGEK